MCKKVTENNFKKKKKLTNPKYFNKLSMNISDYLLGNNNSSDDEEMDNDIDNLVNDMNTLFIKKRNPQQEFYHLLEVGNKLSHMKNVENINFVKTKMKSYHLHRFVKEVGELFKFYRLHIEKHNIHFSGYRGNLRKQYILHLLDAWSLCYNLDIAYEIVGQIYIGLGESSGWIDYDDDDDISIKHDLQFQPFEKIGL